MILIPMITKFKKENSESFPKYPSSVMYFTEVFSRVAKNLSSHSMPAYETLVFRKSSAQNGR